MNLFFIALVLVSGFIIHELLRHRPSLAWFFYFLLPLGLYPFWLESTHLTDWFLQAKTASICLGACLISWLRVKNNHIHFSGPLLIYSLFLLNILLAVWKVLLVGELPSLFNALSGLLLVALYPPLKSISITPLAPHDLSWNASYSWIFAYTLWNFLFVALAYPDALLFGLSALLPPLFISFFHKTRWLQCRVYSLAFYLIAGNTSPYLENLPTSPPPLSENLLLISTAALLGWLGLVFGYKITQHAKNLIFK